MDAESTQRHQASAASAHGYKMLRPTTRLTACKRSSPGRSPSSSPRSLSPSHSQSLSDLRRADHGLETTEAYSQMLAALSVVASQALPSSVACCAATCRGWRAVLRPHLLARRADVSCGSELHPVPLLVADGPTEQPDFVYLRHSKGCDTAMCGRLARVDVAGCDCSPGACTLVRCSCLCAGNAAAYDEHGRLRRLLEDDLKALEPAIIECTSRCACYGEVKRMIYSGKDWCSNAVCSRGMSVRVGVCKTRNRGYGLVALQRIETGVFVCEYAGEYVSSSEAAKRRAVRGPSLPNYAICIREHIGRLVLRTWIDPTVSK